MLKIGVTGGIGSGKSSVCNEFASLGIPVYDSDARAKFLMNQDTALKEAISHHFGSKAYTENGKLDRAYLSSIVFNNSDQLSVLNRLVHPVVMRDSKEWFTQQMHDKQPYAIKESALLYEIGIADQFDYVIVVSVALDIRIQRVMNRDKVNREQVLGRINKQMPQEEKVQLADHIIHNEKWEVMRSSVKELDALFRTI